MTLLLCACQNVFEDIRRLFEKKSRAFVRNRLIHSCSSTSNDFILILIRPNNRSID
jgi:hypothetical protein